MPSDLERLKAFRSGYPDITAEQWKIHDAHFGGVKHVIKYIIQGGQQYESAAEAATRYLYSQLHPERSMPSPIFKGKEGPIDQSASESK